ncbi:MAG: TAL effector repeat-containing protein [Clostridiales bacterium]|nr:TAL effector repeat-containing protein [Clostridiales bacterium]
MNSFTDLLSLTGVNELMMEIGEKLVERGYSNADIVDIAALQRSRITVIRARIYAKEHKTPDSDTLETS